MDIYITQKKNDNYPTRFELWRELSKRGVIFEEYEQLAKGVEGEEYVLNMLNEFGQPHWVILQNIWLDFQGPFECDLAVLTSAGLYPFEIKNYSGHFKFHNGNWSLNGKKIGYNPVYQAIKSTVNIHNMMHLKFPNIHVQGALTFTGEHNVVKILDQVDDIRIVMRNEIRNYIWEIANEEKRFRGAEVDKEQCIKWLAEHETESPFGPETVDLETIAKLQKGICCMHCNSFDLKLDRTYISCACGMHESRENAIIRTICEYGVIHFDKDLVTTDLLDFFNGQISRTNLTYYLNKHFVKVGVKRGSKYLNKGRPLDIVRDEFTLTQTSFLEIKNNRHFPI